MPAVPAIRDGMYQDTFTRGLVEGFETRNFSRKEGSSAPLMPRGGLARRFPVAAGLS